MLIAEPSKEMSQASAGRDVYDTIRLSRAGPGLGRGFHFAPLGLDGLLEAAVAIHIPPLRGWCGPSARHSWIS